jgi:hypothetical protein
MFAPATGHDELLSDKTIASIAGERLDEIPQGGTQFVWMSG